MEGNRRAVESQELKFCFATRSKNTFALCSANQHLGMVVYRSIFKPLHASQWTYQLYESNGLNFAKMNQRYGKRNEVVMDDRRCEKIRNNIVFCRLSLH